MRGLAQRMRRRRPGLRVAVAAVAVVTLGTQAGADEEIVEVAPGAVVRWPGEAIEWCGAAGERWPPLAGECWFPVDLLSPEGSLELAREVSGRREVRTVRVGAYPYAVQRIELQDESRVHLSAEDVARSRRESARVGRLWHSDRSTAFTLPLGAPLADLPEGGRFGARRFFNDQPRSPHSGADFAVPEGTPVLATEGGRVVLAADHFFSGKSVFIDHGGGLVSMYFHLSAIEVAEGGEVERGAPIGRVGASGRATGPHLHFGLRWRGARVDPTLLMQPTKMPALR